MTWRWISLAALLAALVVGYGALMRGAPEQETSEGALEQPGYYLNEAVITQTREDGALDMRVIAERIEQRQSDDSISMRTVRVDYFQRPEQNWLLSANEGLVPADSRVVHLQGDVELQPANAESTSASLRTDALAIDTQRGIAYSTSSPVHIRFGQHGLTVKSFRADLNSEKIRLESVNGRLEPQ
ncbi:MAG: LPS export ABC transporter periplasmic protein LptC [Steroidobacteraceae bacterium]